MDCTSRRLAQTVRIIVSNSSCNQCKICRTQFHSKFQKLIIQGHSPAGGCLLSVCCEYRVMVQNYTIGLNETRLGIAAPSFFQAAFANVMSRREAEKALTLGTMFSTEEAFKVVKKKDIKFALIYWKLKFSTGWSR